MAALTAQRMADIHSKATMPPAKLVPANIANITRITIRSRKRTTTWMDFSDSGKFSGVLTRATPEAAGSSEVVARERLVERALLPPCRRYAAAVRRRGIALHLDEGAEDRER